MQSLLLPFLCGIGFGTIAVLTMLPMSFPDKRTALLAAFASRFAIGFLVPLVTLPFHAAVKGAIVGLLISLPDALMTKAYIPVIGIGIVGGALLGIVSTAF
jgi:hypothetical protein